MARQTTPKAADVGVFCVGDVSAPAEHGESVREGDSCRCIRMDTQGCVTGAVRVGSLDPRKALTVVAMTGRPCRPA